MNILLTIVLIILALIIIFLLIAAFTKKGYNIEREVTINKPVAQVFDYVRYLKNQDHFNKWAMQDPNMKKSFRGTDGAVGSVYAWDGNQRAGKGEQEIMNISENKKLDIEVRFERPFKAVSQSPFTTDAISSNQTKVKWGISSAMKFPMNAMLVIMNLEKMLARDMDESLARLKTNLES